MVTDTIELAVPEPKDLPAYYSFDGWHRATNPSAPIHWYAYIHWNKPGYPPTAQQCAIGLDEVVALSAKAKMKLVKEKIMEAISNNDFTIQALGWDKGSPTIFSNMYPGTSI